MSTIKLVQSPDVSTSPRGTLELTSENRNQPIKKENQMGRRPKSAVPGEVAPATVAAVRRKRRSRIVDHQAQGRILLASLLKSRTERGATQQEALAVVLWARGIHAEATELNALSTRVRRAKTENFADRQVALLLNQALLAGVLEGTLSIDITEAGELTFAGV